MVRINNNQLAGITILDQDGYGTVDCSEAVLENSNALNLNPVSSSQNNSIWIEDASPTLLKFTNSVGSTITLGSGGGGSIDLDGYVVGPSSSSDGIFPVFDSNSGKLLRESNLTLPSGFSGLEFLNIDTGSGTHIIQPQIQSSTNTRGNALSIFSGVGNGSGQSGPLRLESGYWLLSGNVTVGSGEATTNSGNTSVTTGNTLSSDSGITYIKTGNVSNGKAGDVVINPGNGSPTFNSSGGNVSISGGIGYGTGTDGYIELAGFIGKHILTESGTTINATKIMFKENVIVECTSNSAVTFNIPGNIGLRTGNTITVMQSGSGEITFAGTSGMTINARGGALSSGGQYAIMSVIIMSSSTGVLIGDITT